MNKIHVFILYIFYVALAVLVYVVSMRVFSYRPEQGQEPLRQLRYDAVKVCQSLAATKTREDWAYTDCIAEFKKAIDGDRILSL